MNKFYFAICLLAVLCSCGRERRQTVAYDYSFVWPVSREGDFDDSMAYKYVLLSNPPDIATYNSIVKIIYSDSVYYILDGHSRSQLMMYDNTGSFISRINKLGRGPGEYLDISDFSVKLDTIFILDNISDKVLKFNKNGDMLGTVNIPIPTVKAFASTDFGYILHRALYRSDDYNNSYAIYVADHDMNIMERYMEYPSKSPYISFESPFVESDSLVVFNQMFWNQIAIMSRKEPSVKIANIDFGNYNIPDSELDNAEKIIMEPNSYCFLACTPVLADNHIVGKASVRGKMINYVLDMTDGAVRIDNSQAFPFRPGYFSSKGNSGIINWLDIFMYEDKNNNFHLPEDIVRSLEGENLVLITSKFSGQ